MSTSLPSLRSGRYLELSSTDDHGTQNNEEPTVDDHQSEDNAEAADSESESNASDLAMHIIGQVNAGNRTTSRHSQRQNVPGEGTSTILFAVLNFTNSIVGAGIIGLPYAFRVSGFWTGLILMLGVALLVDWTVRILVTCGKLSSRSTYQDLVFYCFGQRGLICVSMFQFLFAFGGMCAYVVIVGDTVPVVLRQLLKGNADETSQVVLFLTGRRFIVTVSTLGICLPLSLYRDITKLAKTSALALGTIIFIVLAVIIEGSSMDKTASQQNNFRFIRPTFIQAVGVISFAFVCHHNSFLIFGSLRRPTLDRWNIVTHLSTGLSAFLSLALGISGFLIFRDSTNANILNNFSADNTLINVARLLFAVNMFTTFPLECFVCREVIENFFFPGQDTSARMNILLTSTLSLIALCIALLTCDLGFVLELTGGLSATALAYIIPASCYLQLASGSVWEWKKAPYIACVAIGGVIMLVSTVQTIVDAVQHHGAASVCNW